MQSRIGVGILFALALAAGACSKDTTGPAPAAPQRTYNMGFSWFPPQNDLPLALQVIELWAPRADAALILTSPPWDLLLAGGDVRAHVQANELGLANHYRSKGLRVFVSIDPTNGLDRSSDAPALVAAGRSLTEVDVQNRYRDYVVEIATQLQPDWLGIASETNFVRAIAPPALYTAVVQAAQTSATAVRLADPDARLFVTIQVEIAWGRPSGSYTGIDVDRTDFPFVQGWGLSSFPYLAGFAVPESLPGNYYARVLENDPLPGFVIESGWPSETVVGIPSTPGRQSRYIRRHAEILDQARAVGWFQITFTDLDVAAWPGTEAFSRLGLVTTTLDPKPALAVWDSIAALPGPR